MSLQNSKPHIQVGPLGSVTSRNKRTSKRKHQKKDHSSPQNHYPIRWGILTDIFTFDLNFTWSHQTVLTLKDSKTKGTVQHVPPCARQTVWRLKDLSVRALLWRITRERKIGYRRRLHTTFEFAKEIWYGKSEQQRSCSLTWGLVSANGKFYFWKNKNMLIHCKSVKTSHSWELATGKVIPL